MTHQPHDGSGRPAHITPAGWNPISTAPHTGKCVELLNDDYSVTEAFWGQKEDECPAGCWIRKNDGHGYVKGDFRFIAWRPMAAEREIAAGREE